MYEIYKSQKKIYEIYEYFRSIEARFHILLEDRRAENERRRPQILKKKVF